MGSGEMSDKVTKQRGGRSSTDRTAGLWKRPFLAAFANSGHIRASALAAGVNRQHVYTTLHKDAAFRAEFDEAKEESIELLEATLRQMALGGNVTALIFLLKSLDPATYHDRVQVAQARASNPVELIATMKLSDKE